jgi:hypothetical protein
MRALTVAAAAMLLAVCTHPVWAAVAVESCISQPLSSGERANLSDVVFEGTITSASCKCMKLASDDDDDGPQVECTDAIKVTKPIKGEVESQFTFKNMVMLDPDPGKTLSHGTCKDRVSDRNDRLVGKDTTFYMHRNAEGFLETVPASVCR